VLLVVCDALRYDALRMDHDGRPTAFTERLGSWITFDRCYAAAPWTLPAMQALLCGVDSTQSRLRSRREGPTPTLIGRFDRLHRVALVNNGVIRTRSELADGFDEFRWITDHAETFSRARAFLSGRSSDPAAFFLYVHTNLVHDYPQESGRREFARWFPSSAVPDIGARVLTWAGLEDKADAVRKVYDACVLSFHEELEALLEVTPLDRTVVVLIADHGEGMEPAIARIHHGGRLHDDLLHIPCVIHLPEDAVDPAARARLVDLAARPFGAFELLPALLQVTGHGDGDGPPDVTADDAPLSDPSSSRVLRAEDPKYVYLANRFRLNSNPRGKHTTAGARLRNRLWRRTLSRSTLLQAFVDWPYKLLVTRMEAANGVLAQLGRPVHRRVHRGRPLGLVRGRLWIGFELYDLSTDPGEASNLLPRRSDVAEAAWRLVERLEKGDTSHSVGSLVASSPEQ